MRDQCLTKTEYDSEVGHIQQMFCGLQNLDIIMIINYVLFN